MENLKKLLWLALGMAIVFAIVDALNLNGTLFHPVTYIRGLISGKTDPTVGTLNSPAQV